MSVAWSRTGRLRREGLVKCWKDAHSGVKLKIHAEELKSNNSTRALPIKNCFDGLDSLGT